MNPDSKRPSLPKRKALPHATPPWADSNSVFFISISCSLRTENQLCHPAIATAIFETVEFRQTRGDWYVRLFLLMPDHVHALMSFPHDRVMREVISKWKETVAKRTGVRWQRDFFDHRLRAEESYEDKARYIRMNPVRKQLVEKPDAWPFIWEPN